MQKTLHTVPFWEALNRGTGRILSEDSSHSLLWEETSRCYFVTCRDPEAARKLAAAIPPSDLILTTELHTAKVFSHCWQLKPPLVFLQTVYEKTEPLPLSGLCEIRVLGTEYAGILARNYEHIPEEEYFRARTAAGHCFGAFLDGQLAGFGGIHDDGSMGFLQVFPDFRRRGIGRELLCYMVNYHLDRGWTPYAHVFAENEASLALQRQLGFSLCDKPVYWCF